MQDDIDLHNQRASDAGENSNQRNPIFMTKKLGLQNPQEGRVC